MAYKDTIDSLKSTVQARVADMDKSKDALQAELANLESLESDFDARVEDEKKKSYDEGFDAGVLQNAKAGDKQFSLDEMNAEIGPRDAKIKELEAKIEPLQAKVDDLTKTVDQQAADAKAAQDQVQALDDKIKAASDQAVAEYKAKVRQAYEDQQVAEQAGETGFGELLK